MSKKLALLISYVSFMVFCCVNPTNGAQFFQDGFESGDLSHVENLAKWSGVGGSVTVSTDTYHTGSRSLKFHFVGNSDLNADADAEADFSLGTAKTNVYIRYYVKFPSNYVHRYPSSSNNNKAIRLWGNSYTADTIKMGASFWANTSGAPNLSTLSPDSCYDGTLNCAVTTIGAIDKFMTSATRNWVLTSANLNKWLCFEWHFKGDSGAGDGAIEFWVDGVKQFGSTTLKFSNTPCSPGYFMNGYLFGWSNSGFTNDTDIYVDDVVFSDSYIGPMGSGPASTSITNYSYTK